VKNLSLALNGILLLAVAVLYYLHFSTSSTSAVHVPAAKKDPSAVVESAKPGDLKASDIVFVNLDSLNAHYEFILDNSKVLTARQNAYENEYQQLNEQFQKHYEESGKAAQSGMLSGAALEEIKAKLQVEQNEVMKKQDQLRSLEGDMQRKVAEVQKKVTDFLTRYNSAGHYRYILSYTANTVSSVLYGRLDQDITPEVVKGLNEEYRAAKKSK
jgi:outer membrane protein